LNKILFNKAKLFHKTGESNHHQEKKRDIGHTKHNKHNPTLCVQEWPLSQ